MGKWCFPCSDAFKIQIDWRDLICTETAWGEAVRLGGQSFPSCCTVLLCLESHRPVLNHIQIYFLLSEDFASNIPWPLSLLAVNQTRPSKSHLASVLILVCSWLSVQTVQCLLVMMSQNPWEGAAAQRYKLNLVPASRGHCCSINFSKRHFWDLPWLFSLMFYSVLIYLDSLLHLQSLFWLRNLNFWKFRTQIATWLSPRSWKERAFSHASFQPGMHCSWKCCWLAPALHRLCVLDKWSAGGIEV